MISDPPKATNSSLVREETAVPNLTEPLAIANVINGNLKKSLGSQERCKELTSFFPLCDLQRKGIHLKRFCSKISYYYLVVLKIVKFLSFPNSDFWKSEEGLKFVSVIKSIRHSNILRAAIIYINSSQTDLLCICFICV